MKTKTDWDRDIMKVTGKIQKKFPELTKYILETPIRDLETDEIGVYNLEEYYDSLECLMASYSKTHKSAQS